MKHAPTAIHTAAVVQIFQSRAAFSVMRTTYVRTVREWLTYLKLHALIYKLSPSTNFSDGQINNDIDKGEPV